MAFLDSNLFSVKNPFVSLSISADSSGRKINECAKLAAMRSKLMDSSSGEDLQQIRLAAEQLRDPVQRFIWSLFWVTLTEEEEVLWKENAVLSNLSNDWGSSSIKEYESIRKSDDLSVWAHNKAVLSLGAAITHETKENWRYAFDAWRLVVESSDLWELLQSRAVELDDPRIGHAEVQQCRKELSLHLLGYCANEASTALINNDVSIAEHWIAIIREAPFASSDVDNSLGNIYEPFVKRINLRLDKLESQTSGENVPTKTLNQLLDDFESDVLPLIRQILQIGDLPGLAEEYARDRAATFLRELGIDLSNCNNQYGSTHKAIQWALEFVDSKTLRRKLEGDLKITKKFMHIGPSLALVKKGQYSESVSLIDKLIEEASLLGLDVSIIELQTAKDQLKDQIAIKIFNKTMERFESRVTNASSKPSKQLFDDAVSGITQALSYAVDPEGRTSLRENLNMVKELRGRFHGASCFVATATFGSADHITVRNLRDFRDLVLDETTPGRLFVRLYWLIGPYLASGVRVFPITKILIRPALQLIAYMLLKTKAYRRASKGVQLN